MNDSNKIFYDIPSSVSYKKVSEIVIFFTVTCTAKELFPQWEYQKIMKKHDIQVWKYIKWSFMYNWSIPGGYWDIFIH